LTRHKRLPPRKTEKPTLQSNPAAQFSLFEPSFLAPSPELRPSPHLFSRLSPAVPSPAFNHYWRFAAERQNVFFRRFLDLSPPWTDDPVLRVYKFTNAYRASDRVTQYLISRVIYSDADRSFESVFFRVILFKLFNRIGTWEFLLRELQDISPATFTVDRYASLLSRRLATGVPIYSAAYMMPSGRQYREKHKNHLQLLDLMLTEQLPARLLAAKRMSEAYDLLVSYPMIGPFLAYQYLTDLNYSSWMHFRENDFVVPGPGALDGIAKCFTSLGDLSPSDVIRFVVDLQGDTFSSLGVRFLSLWGRPLQLIDCQNLFCEADKYLRVVLPSIKGLSGRLRIKQTFRPTFEPLTYWYPPKWGLNHVVKQTSHAHSLDILADAMETASGGG
jgi:hypothetical protein